MLILVVLLASLLVAVARGGRLANLGALSFRYFPVLFIPLVLQIILFSPLRSFFPLESGAVPSVYLLSMLLGAVVVGLNLRLPGFALLFVGLALNLAAILMNDGHMPVSMQAREFAGMTLFHGVLTNLVEMTPTTPLWFLGDLLPVPRGVPWANVFSVGDLMITAGGVWFLQRALLPPRDSPLPEWVPPGGQV